MTDKKRKPSGIVADTSATVRLDVEAAAPVTASVVASRVELSTVTTQHNVVVDSEHYAHTPDGRLVRYVYVTTKS